MPRNGSGTYTLPTNSWNPASTGVVINSTDWNSTAADIVAAMSASIANDGQTAATARIPFALGLSTPAGIHVNFGGTLVVGSIATSPVASCAFDVQSTTGGICVPRLTTTQRDALSSPPDGLMVYNSTLARFQHRAASAWWSTTPAYARVKKAANQTAANYVTPGAVVAWDAEDLDVGSWHDNVTNNSRLTVPAGVTVAEFSGCVGLDLDTGSTWKNVYLYKNGAVYLQFWWNFQPTDVHWVGPFSTGPLSVAPGDYFELFLEEQSDTSITVLASLSYFSAKAIA